MNFKMPNIFFYNSVLKPTVLVNYWQITTLVVILHSKCNDNKVIIVITIKVNLM